MNMWLRRLWGKNFVKMTRRIGEDEILEVSFNENDGAKSIARTHEWLDFLLARMDDHNKRVLNIEQPPPQPGQSKQPTRIK